MNSDINYNTYENGYSVGWAEGKYQGYSEGYTDGYRDAELAYEPRLAKYWAELQTLNARIDHLTKVVGLDNA